MQITPTTTDAALVFHHPRHWDILCVRVLGTGLKPFVVELPEGFRELHRRCVHHSPDGYNWGYGGSGPADLALSIADHLVPPGLDGLRPEKCWEGWVSPTAFVIHQDIKTQFLIGMPVSGGQVNGNKLLRFVKNLLPPGFEWCGDHYERQEGEPCNDFDAAE